MVDILGGIDLGERLLRGGVGRAGLQPLARLDRVGGGLLEQDREPGLDGLRRLHLVQLVRGGDDEGVRCPGSEHGVEVGVERDAVAIRELASRRRGVDDRGEREVGVGVDPRKMRYLAYEGGGEAIGALIGGFLANNLLGVDAGGNWIVGVVVATVGAVILLFLLGLIKCRA